MTEVLKYMAEGNCTCPKTHFNALLAAAVRVCPEYPTLTYISLV